MYTLTFAGGKRERKDGRKSLGFDLSFTYPETDMMLHIIETAVVKKGSIEQSGQKSSTKIGAVTAGSDEMEGWAQYTEMQDGDALLQIADNSGGADT